MDGSEIVKDCSCPVCGGPVVKDTKNVPSRPPEWMIMGPGGEDNYRQVTSYHCSKCLVMFAGQPPPLPHTKSP